MTQQAQFTARILVVDDEQSIREMLKAGLSRAGYECATAQSAADAAELLEIEHYDLVLLDINMPGKTGIEFLPEIKEQHPDVAVMMLTGEADVSLAVRSMREGAYDYALKPVGLAELVIRIEHALSRRALVLENRAYKDRLEKLVDELNARLEQRKRELGALNKLFQSHIGQEQIAQSAFLQLQGALTHFSSELEGLATIVGVAGDDEDDTAAEYQVRKVK